VIIATGPSPLWYLARGAGSVTLVLLSVTLALGISGALRWQPGRRIPRFIVDGLHRNLSLLAVVFLVLHILTSVLDPFAHMKLLDAVVPLTSSYRPLWVGLGALALDLLLALVLTSLVRRRLGLRAWRLVHWTAYACWPVAVLHGLGTGTDARSGWFEILTAVCVLGVVAAIGSRLAAGGAARVPQRAGGLAALAAATLGIVVFAAKGPLAPGWAKRAGTPATLLAATARPVSLRTAPATVALPFSAPVDGTIRRVGRSDGSAEVDIAAAVRVSRAPVQLGIQLVGSPLNGGGLQMSSSSVTMGPRTAPDLYTGRIVGLQGSNLLARVRRSSGRTVALRVNLVIPRGSSALTGTAIARESA
jgi:hypothetical protein